PWEVREPHRWVRCIGRQHGFVGCGIANRILPAFAPHIEDNPSNLDGLSLATLGAQHRDPTGFESPRDHRERMEWHVERGLDPGWRLIDVAMPDDETTAWVPNLDPACIAEHRGLENQGQRAPGRVRWRHREVDAHRGRLTGCQRWELHWVREQATIGDRVELTSSDDS